VVVFSHGLGGWPGAYERLVTRWAAAGLVVVAPTYPMTSRGAGWDSAHDVRNQSADASFVLTSILREQPALGPPSTAPSTADGSPAPAQVA
jgi:predicted dienelactone hydrolase